MSTLSNDTTHLATALAERFKELLAGEAASWDEIAHTVPSAWTGTPLKQCGVAQDCWGLCRMMQIASPMHGKRNRNARVVLMPRLGLVMHKIFFDHFNSSPCICHLPGCTGLVCGGA